MIIFINGSINAGKSTVAKILARRISNTAVVEIDILREMINWMPIDQAVPINLENAVSVIRNLAKRNMNIVVPYPLSEDNYKYLINELEDINSEIYFFTLAPKLDKVLTNRGGRELSDSEQKRIKHHYDIGINNPAFGEIIDNSNQTPEETTNYILSKLN